MSPQQAAQTLNDRVATELDTDATASTSGLHRENMCVGVVTVVVGAAADIAAFDVAAGAAALAATALAVVCFSGTLVNLADGWLAADGGVGPVVIVGVQPGRECVAAG